MPARQYGAVSKASRKNRQQEGEDATKKKQEQDAAKKKQEETPKQRSNDPRVRRSQDLLREHGLLIE